jgi:hypothetical protein
MIGGVMNQQEFIAKNQMDYPEGFFQWLQTNRDIWKEFEAMALKMAKRRTRYSARTIVEVMRWNTDLREKPDVTFKLSNNMTPGMARLWMRKHGKRHPKFFSLHNREN